MDNFISDNLLNPNRLDKNGRPLEDKDKINERKINVAEDGLLERKQQKVLTNDGRELLKEDRRKNIL